MGFTELENKGKKALERYPGIKKAAKRVYQLLSVGLSGNRIRSEGDLIKVSPEDGFEYFYGYYDKSPWDASERYMLALKAEKTYESPAPKEPAEVILIDTKEDNQVYKLGTTRSWNVQQGCRAQWLGPDFASRIIYNDYRNGSYVSVLVSLKGKKEEKVLPLPVYDVSRDGSFALSLDFSRLARLRPGYGYENIPDKTKGQLCPEGPCIQRMDLETGEITDLLTYKEVAAFEPDPSMEGAEHKVNHLMINPSGTRFMFIHRWFKEGRKHSRLLTADADGSGLYNLSDEVFVSHCFWKSDTEILSFLRKKETGDHYYLLKDQSQEYKMLWPRLKTDGHCSYSPDRKYVITDTYPNRKRLLNVYLCEEGGDEAGLYERVCRVYAPFRYDNDVRCDLHPRWDPSGEKICIDSVHEGKRGLYVIPLGRRIRK